MKGRADAAMNRKSRPVPGEIFLSENFNPEILLKGGTGNPDCIHIQIIALGGGYLYRDIPRNLCHYARKKNRTPGQDERETELGSEPNPGSNTGEVPDEGPTSVADAGIQKTPPGTGSSEIRTRTKETN